MRCEANTYQGRRCSYVALPGGRLCQCHKDRQARVVEPDHVARVECQYGYAHDDQTDRWYLTCTCGVNGELRWSEDDAWRDLTGHHLAAIAAGGSFQVLADPRRSLTL